MADPGPAGEILAPAGIDVIGMVPKRVTGGIGGLAGVVLLGEAYRLAPGDDIARLLGQVAVDRKAFDLHMDLARNTVARG